MRVGVVGGGAMGVGIAHACVVAGHSVCVVERDHPSAERAAEAVDSSLRRVRLGIAPVDGHRHGPIAVSARMADIHDVDLVVEAVYEDVAVKLDVLSALERIVGEDAILATNTSSIAIGELGIALDDPARLLGLHFFNPVPVSRLVEMVVGRETRSSAVKTAREFVISLDKTPVTVGDSPGFASSRLGVSMGLEAIRMLEEDVASAENIDQVMLLGYRHPIGPLALTDLVGLDVRLAIADYLMSTLGARFSPPQLLRDKVRAGELGRKTGRGFFVYQRAGAE